MSRLIDISVASINWSETPNSQMLSKIFRDSDASKLWKVVRKHRLHPATRDPVFQIDDLSDILEISKDKAIYIWEFFMSFAHTLIIRDLITTLILFSTASANEKLHGLLALHDDTSSGRLTAREFVSLVSSVLIWISRTYKVPRSVKTTLQNAESFSRDFEFIDAFASKRTLDWYSKEEFITPEILTSLFTEFKSKYPNMQVGKSISSVNISSKDTSVDHNLKSAFTEYYLNRKSLRDSKSPYFPITHDYTVPNTLQTL